MKEIPDFKTEPDRRAWFIKEADYFTAVSRRKYINERAEFKTLAQAEAFAKECLKRDTLVRPYMIYAVVNNSDSFVKVVYREPDGYEDPT